MVFDPAAAPGRTRPALIAWLEDEAEWGDGPYDDPEVAARPVRAWLEALLREFPARSGPRAHPDPADPRVTDYTIGRAVAHASFPWTVVEVALDAAMAAAAAHGLGVYDAGSEGLEVWLPDAAGALAVVQAKTKKKKATKKKTKTKATKKKTKATKTKATKTRR